MIVRGLKSLAKAVVSPLVDATGLYERRIRRVSSANGLWVIVMYHRVIVDRADDPFALGMCVHRENFEQQIAFLRSRFEPIAMGEACRRIAQGQPLPARALSVTFDDGYHDNLAQAQPVLERWGMPWTLYVTTGGFEAGDPLWWDRVILALDALRGRSLDWVSLGLDESCSGPAVAASRYGSSAERALDLLWEMPQPQRSTCIEAIEKAAGPAASGRAAPRRLNAQELRQLHARGVEIGAHTVTHTNLAMCTPQAAHEELSSSRQFLENLLQAPVPGLAYPGGYMGAQVENIVRELGFAHAVSTSSGVNQPEYEMTRLRRIGMPDAALADFRRALGSAMTRQEDSSHGC